MSSSDNRYERVSYPSTRTNLEGEAMGYLYNQGQSTAGVVLIHEWWGVNKFAHDMASMVAEAGFCVLAADVFRGHLFQTHPEARKNMMTMDYTQAAMDISAAAQFLRKSGCTKVGVMGFGFGASLSVVSAALHPDDFQAVAPNCGVPRPQLADVTKIKGKVQGHYAAHDKVVGVASPADVKGLEDRLTEGGVKYEMISYDANHAFCVPTYDAFNSERRDDFLANLFKFFKEELF